jgi:hypothetical protein
MIKENKNEIVENYEKIQSFAQTEIDRVHKIYKLLAWILGLIFTVGITLASILIDKSVSDIEKKYEQKYLSALDEAKMNIRKEIDDELKIAREKINTEINQEFEKDNIQNMVIDQTKMRIDEIADPIISSQIFAKIKPIENDLNNIQIEINRILIDYYLLAFNNDSREAFLKVYQFANDPNFVKKDEAKLAINKRIRGMENFLSRENGMFDDLNYTFVKSPSDFFRYYNDSIGSDSKLYAIEALWNYNKFNKEQKISIYEKLLPVETSFDCSYYMSSKIIDFLNLKLQPYEFKDIENKIKTSQIKK